MQRYIDYKTKDVFASIFSKSNEDKNKITPLKSIIYQGVAQFLSQIKSIGLYEL